MKKVYETDLKMDGRWIYVGWTEIDDEEFIIATKENAKFIYITHKWLDGTMEEKRYRKNEL